MWVGDGGEGVEGQGGGAREGAVLERTRTRAAVEKEVEKEASVIEAGVRVVGVAVVGSEVVVRAAEETAAVAKAVGKVAVATAVVDREKRPSGGGDGRRRQGQRQGWWGSGGDKANPSPI